MSKLDEILGQTIQVSRIGRATDPKPKDRVWFTTQMQDLFVLDPTYAKQQIKDLMLELIGDNEERPASGPKRNGVDQGLRRARNKIRNELRLKVEEL